MGRAPCCSKEGLRKGPWSIKEDSLLSSYIQNHGEGHWKSLPKKAGLLRCGKSCRLRWMNYLRPGIKRGNFTPGEDDLIVRLHSLLGNRWSLIAGRLPGRTDNEIKNYWNTHLLKKLKNAGIEPKPGKLIKTVQKKKRTTKADVEPEKKTGSYKGKKHHYGNKPVLDRVRPEMTKVYAPRPIRVPTGFTRNFGFDYVAATTSSATSGDQKLDGNDKTIPWNLYEVGDDLFDYFTDGCDLSSEYFVPTNDALLEKVYDEYLQLLSENCFIQHVPTAEN